MFVPVPTNQSLKLNEEGKRREAGLFLAGARHGGVHRALLIIASLIEAFGCGKAGRSQMGGAQIGIGC